MINQQEDLASTEQDTTLKRKNSGGEEDNNFLDLKLGCCPYSPPPRNNNNSAAAALQPPQPQILFLPIIPSPTPTISSPNADSASAVPIPYPWATDRRANIHSIKYLQSKQILKISGKVQCKKCQRHYEIEFDLVEKFREIWKYVAENRNSMRDRAPGIWMNPRLPSCEYCESECSVKPVISDKKKSINWLFLLLGQMLGCCTLQQLKYFCKHTKNHRTGAKNRVLYLTYLALCKQLHPEGPFDR